MQVYVEVSRNHGYSLEYVMRNKFNPEIRLLILYYNNKLRLEQKEYEKIEQERKKQEQ
jgi:hypothetical protein